MWRAEGEERSIHIQKQGTGEVEPNPPEEVVWKERKPRKTDSLCARSHIMKSVLVVYIHGRRTQRKKLSPRVAQGHAHVKWQCWDLNASQPVSVSLHHTASKGTHVQTTKSGQWAAFQFGAYALTCEDVSNTRLPSAISGSPRRGGVVCSQAKKD